MSGHQFGDGLDDNVDDLALGDALRRMAGGIPDADAALAGLHRRVRVARMRRISAVAASVAIVAASGTALGLTAGRSGDRIGPSDTPVTLPDDSTTRNGTDPSTSGTDSTDSTANGGNSSNGDDTPETSVSGSGATPTTRPSSGSNATSTTSPTSAPTTTTSTTIDDHSDDDDGGDDDSERSNGSNGSSDRKRAGEDPEHGHDA